MNQPANQPNTTTPAMPDNQPNTNTPAMPDTAMPQPPQITITKINPDGDLLDLITLTDTTTIPQHYYNLGYRIADETLPPEPPLTPDDIQNLLIYIPTRQHNPDTDTNYITYKKTFDTCRAECQINNLTQQLAATDYIITKYQEAMLISALPASDTTPTLTTDNLNLDQYPLATILQNRATLRQQIRQLQNLLNENKQ